jgi:hypothetical protein
MESPVPQDRTRSSPRPAQPTPGVQATFAYEFAGKPSAPVRRESVPARTATRGVLDPLPTLRFEIHEASRILRMSRAQLYKRIKTGAIRIQKDGARTYVTAREIDRYVDACD